MAAEAVAPVTQGLDFAGIEESDLKQIIAQELSVAVGAEGGRLSQERLLALQYYRGDAFDGDQDLKSRNRSTVVMRSVLETVEWVLPALLRIFTASDKIAQMEPAGASQDEAAADQATDYITQIFYKDNPGFLILHDWFKDALIEKVGWVKRWWDTQQVQETNTYEKLTAEQYAAAKTPSEPDVVSIEVVDETEQPGPPNPLTGQPTLLYDCKLRTTRRRDRIKIENVPPEEVLIGHRAKRGNIPFLCHRRQRTRSDLLEEGYDKSTLALLPGYDSPEYGIERITRYEDEDEVPYNAERTDKAMRLIWIEENYLKVDIDGDGIAELCKIVTTGNGALILTKDGEPDIEQVDEITLVPACPVPMPHKLVGMSLADLVMDLQLIKSTLVRQMLDNLYLTNDPRHYVDESKVTENTYDDLLTSRPGGVVRGRGEGAVTPLTTPFVAEAAVPMLEYIDQTSEVRTGVSRRNQGLSPDDLNKTATGMNLVQQAAAQRVELIARIFGHSVKELIEGIIGLVRRYQQQARIVRVTGKPLAIDPRGWRESMDVNVSVGLGTGNRDQIVADLMKVLQAQFQIVQMQKGLNGPLVYGKNVFDALEFATENLGLKQSFFTDPTQPPPPGYAGPPGQQQQPDPEMMKAHQDLAIAQAKSQAEAQEQAVRLRADMTAMQQKAELEAQLAQQRAQLEMDIDRQRAAHEIEMEKMRAAAKLELEKAEIALRAQAGAYTPGPAPEATPAA